MTDITKSLVLLRTTRHVLALGVAALAGCDASSSIGTPVRYALPLGPRPTLVSILPGTGSTGGATPLELRGTGFGWGANVTIAGVKVDARCYRRYSGDTALAVVAPAHPAGPVDVVVTNADGQSVALPRGYWYVPPESFLPDGFWSGFGNAGQDIPILFMFRDGALTNVYCDEYSSLTFSPPLEVRNGQFSFRWDGVNLTGRITSASTADGTIDLAPCVDTNWNARQY